MFIPIEFQKAFQKTEQTAIAITATYAENPSPTVSRFGGNPYWEKGVDVPVDEHGEALALLAQINFSELPDNDIFPASGVLQFFIPRDDEDYGANVEEVGGVDDVFVHFWKSPCDSQAVTWNIKPNENDLIPVFGAHTMTFDSKIDVAGIDTIECAEVMGRNPFEVLEDVALSEKEENQFFDDMLDFVAPQGHKLLGYPGFVNGDPREFSDYRLLLQIDTDMDDDNDIMWGDNGIGHIFIRDEDLKMGRFENVWLYWDC